MITKDNLKSLLTFLNFSDIDNIFTKEYKSGARITVNFPEQKIIYEPLDNSFKNGEFPTKDKPASGFIIHRDTTLNFKSPENFVCLVCVHLLLKKGYEPKHIVFEPAFKVGHVNKPSYGDILVFDKEYKPLVLIENKTFGKEFSNEWNNMQKDGGQLFSYLGPLVNELGFCENIVLFASDFDNNLIPKSHIITLKDNEKRISELENPKTFANAQGKYFEVWDETYAKSFETKGLFEDDIEPYSIGKLKYTIKDLKELSHAEIRPIYHEFATILRNHAITDFEHSFYILIDLFLCKITDERNNPNDLQFYYKGITRDTPKEYCARLLSLYQLGKKQLFDVDVVNKEESDILQIFEDTNRSVTNGLFAGIKELFEEIKFYNIKKFNFIDVENKEEFEMNFQILIKIAALIQDINLSNSETNHFFGDLFEGLLSKNVHQTEGQFFTPLPIVNFIIKSLPEFPNSNSLKILDYACGAGHFLTEFVKLYPQAKAYGIEKSQPLSQVAKIATIINGSKESHIAFKDSLSVLNTQQVRFQGFDKDSFDCIIANPPYSVKGFLNTMTLNDRNQFDLIKFVEEKAYDSNKSIECFFVERSKHFLKQNGFMGIVLPSSILSNGNLYTKVREILFAHFNILAIVNLGSRTFGSTGTNTIILFAQKVAKNSEGLLHTFIEKKDYTQYLSYKAIDSYIEKQGYKKDDYFAFMQDDILTENLENNEIFKEYKKSFTPIDLNKTKQNELFKASSFFNAGYKEKSDEYKQLFSNYLASDEYKIFIENENKKQFIKYAKEIECDKLNTYIQIENNIVAILQSPPDKIGNKSNKAEVVKFLGYDWSNRKGDEGIKYITNKPIVDEEPEKKKEKKDKDEKEDKDTEIVNAINSIKFIETPLYNPDNSWDNSKFAFAIRKHILSQCTKTSYKSESNYKELLEKSFSNEMENLLSFSKLSDLIDFSSSNFEKGIKTSSSNKIEYTSKYDFIKLKDICDDIISGQSPESKYYNDSEKGLPFYQGKKDFGEKFILEPTTWTSYTTKESIKDDILMSVRAPVGDVNLNPFTKICIGRGLAAIRVNNEKLRTYIFNYLRANKDYISGHQGSTFDSISRDELLAIKIPLPPTDIQEQIVIECEKIDKNYSEAHNIIENNKKQILKLMEDGQNQAVTSYKLSNSDIFDVSTGRRIVSSELNDNYDIPVYSANVFEPFGKINKLLITTFDVPSVIWGIDGDWMVNVIPENQQFYPTDHCGVLRIKNNMFEPKYVSWVLNKVGLKEGFKRSYRPSLDRVEALSLKLPSLKVQKEIVSKIENLEKEIKDAEEILSNAAKLKQAVLDKYLK